MSKIEEMATELGYHTDTFNRAEFTANEVRQACIDGANAVLREIDKLVSKFDTYPGYQYNDLYVRLKDKLNELKGE